MFSSKSFTVIVFIVSIYMIQLKLIFFLWCEVGVELPFYPGRHIVISAPCEKMTFPLPIESLWYLFKSNSHIEADLFQGSLSCSIELFVDP